MMNIYVKGSLLSLTLLMSACGSDDIDAMRDTTQDLTKVKETWAEYYYSGESETDNSLTKYTTLRDGQFVYHFEHSEYSDYKEDDNHKDDESSTIYLTKNEIINPHAIYNQQHVLAFELISHTDQKWITSALNQNKKTNLQFTDEYKIIDLSGQRLTDHISQTLMLLSKDKNYLAIASESYNNRISAYLKQFDGHVFPTGSKCRIYDKSYINQDYAAYYTPALKQSEFIDIETYLDVDQKGYSQTQLTDHQIYFKNISYLDSLAHRAVINKDNAWYDAYYYNNGLTADTAVYQQNFKKMLDEEIVKYGEDSEELQQLQAYYKIIPTQCNNYNDVAIAKIDVAQKIKP